MEPSKQKGLSGVARSSNISPISTTLVEDDEDNGEGGGGDGETNNSESNLKPQNGTQPHLPAPLHLPAPQLLPQVQSQGCSKEPDHDKFPTQESCGTVWENSASEGRSAANDAQPITTDNDTSINHFSPPTGIACYREDGPTTRPVQEEGDSNDQGAEAGGGIGTLAEALRADDDHGEEACMGACGGQAPNEDRDDVQLERASDVDKMYAGIEIDLSEEGKRCLHCHKANRQVVLKPCGHKILCNKCFSCKYFWRRHLEEDDSHPRCLVCEQEFVGVIIIPFNAVIFNARRPRITNCNCFHRKG